MVRIKSQKELRDLYPKHFKVLQGYWLSGVTIKEKLDQIVEKLEQGKPGAGKKKAGPTGAAQKEAGKKEARLKKQPPAPTSAPSEAKEEPPPRPKREKPLSPEKVAYVRKFREGRKKAGPAAAYYDRMKNEQTPLVFRGYRGQEIPCTIKKDGGDRFTLVCGGQRQVVWKTSLQYAYKELSRADVEKAVEFDDGVRAQNLEPVLPVEGRHQIPDEDLQACREQGHRLRLTMRGGEVLEGRLEWFGAYDIKLEMKTGRSVAVFRHAVFGHAVVQEG